MKTRLCALLIASAFLAGCVEKKPAQTIDPGAPDDVPPMKQADTSKDGDFVGLTVEEGEAMAKERKLVHRIVSVDGDVRPVTMDYRPDRINFTVEIGKIVKVTRG